LKFQHFEVFLFLINRRRGYNEKDNNKNAAAG